MATPFLSEIVRTAMGEGVQFLSEQSEQSPTVTFDSGIVVEDGEDFADAVQRRLQTGPVLAVPSWDQGRSPLAPVIGQELAERVRLAEHPLGLLIPITSLASVSRSVKFREALLHHNRSLFILETYDVIANIHSTFLTCLVVLHPERQGQESRLRFARVPRPADEEAVLEDIQRLVRMPGGSRQTGFVYRGPVDPFSPLTYQHYDPVLRARKEELRTWGSGTTLDELFEVRVPHPAPVDGSDTSAMSHGRYVRGRSIQPGGRLDLTDSETVPSTRPLPLEAGDLVMRGMFQPSDRGGINVAEVREDHLPAAALHGVLVLRPRRDLSSAERLLLLHYLRSDLAKDLLVAAGAKLHVVPSLLRNLYLPVAEERLLAAVESIVEIGRTLSQWNEDAITALDSIFALDSPAEAREALLERGRDSRLRVDAARSVDEFDYRVRTLYPYPVAYRWRSLSSVRSTGDAQQTLREVRHGFEHIMAFAGCVAAGVARSEGLDLPALRQFGATDGYKTFLSTWTEILSQVGRKVRVGETDNPLLIRLATFSSDLEVAAALKRLTDYRNAESHTLSADEDALAEGLVIDVQTIVHGLRFLADYELVEITHTRWDGILRQNTVDFRAYVGDHPVVPVSKTIIDDSEIDTGSLYIRVRETGELVAPLRPYLLGHRCDNCKQWATYYLHGISGGVAKIKSIEHGHDNDVEDLPEVLRAVAAGIGSSLARTREPGDIRG